MSIVASVKVHDGIAIGADAMSTILGRDAQGNVGVVKTYEHAEKLFRLGQTPIGVAVYGIGNIGPRSIGSFIHEFGKKLTEPEDVEKVAADLLAFLRSQYDAQLRDVAQVPAEQRPQLGVLIAGYSPNEPLADEWEFVIPFDQTPRRVRPPGTFGADCSVHPSVCRLRPEPAGRPGASRRSSRRRAARDGGGADDGAADCLRWDAAAGRDRLPGVHLAHHSVGGTFYRRLGFVRGGAEHRCDRSRTCLPVDQEA